MRFSSSFWLFLTVNSRTVIIEDDNQKNVNLESFHRKVQKGDHDLNQARLNPSLTNQSKFAPKVEQDKVSSLLGTQQANTNSQFGAVYRITCWDSSENGRAGCIYQAPNRFIRGGVTHFWLSSEEFSIRWIHFYDANIIPTNSDPYANDYAISHTNNNFEGIDYVNFIVMFEEMSSDSGGIPADTDWIVFNDPTESWRTALFSFPSNYEGNRARTNIQTSQGNFKPDNIVIITFPSVVKNLRFDEIDGMEITGILDGSYAQVVTLTNIPSYVKQIWLDFEYLDSERGQGIDPIGNWFDATSTSVNIY